MIRQVAGTLGVALVGTFLVGCDVEDGANGADGSNTQGQTIALRFLSNVRNPAAGFDKSAAEIVSFDAATQRSYVVNAQSGAVDIFDLSAPSAPSLEGSLDVASDVAALRPELADASSLGAVNSVAINAGVVATAIEANPKPEFWLRCLLPNLRR